MNQIIPAGIEEAFRQELKHTFIRFSSTARIEVSEKSIQRVINQGVRLWCYIYEKQRIQSSLSARPFDYYVNIYSIELRDKFRTAIAEFTPVLKFSYTYFTDILEKYGFIEKNNSYSNIYHYTKSYRVCIDKLENYTYYNQPRIYRNEMDWIREYSAHKLLIQNHYRSIIDVEGAIAYIKSLKGFGYKDKIVDDIRIFRWLREVYNIQQKQFWFGVSDSGRFYSTYTNLPSFIRKFIKFDDDEMATLDLRNAQPLFLSHLINHTQMKESCSQGVFYDKLVEKTPNIPRQKMKEMIYRLILFNENPIKKEHAFARLVDSVYPNLIDKINDCKKNNKLWLELQKIESSIFIDGVKSIDYPYLTIHDGLSVPKKYLQQTKTLLEKIIKEKGYIGIVDIS